MLATVALATSCDGSSARSATVPVDRVTGVWKSGEATLALTADHTFTASGLNEGKLTDTGCPVGHADGDWAFFADQGDGLYVTSRQARSGSEVGLSFTEPSDEPCRLTLTVVDDDTYAPRPTRTFLATWASAHSRALIPGRVPCRLCWAGHHCRYPVRRRPIGGSRVEASGPGDTLPLQ
ncbi:hypothetical protein J2S54_006800 [Streptomyces sp. DSM 42143]|uniref:hypothetical protein n=1 Tax=Streptomyces TaxID=1883 RepID=UPI002780D415|nr:hypothetical protein [Streptomyces sp. DSM 42143]MDQ0389980.1 hypothetical protein [Streptomyces sp. DSM 42143]